MREGAGRGGDCAARRALREPHRHSLSPPAGGSPAARVGHSIRGASRSVDARLRGRRVHRLRQRARARRGAGARAVRRRRVARGRSQAPPIPGRRPVCSRRRLNPSILLLLGPQRCARSRAEAGGGGAGRGCDRGALRSHHARVGASVGQRRGARRRHRGGVAGAWACGWVDAAWRGGERSLHTPHRRVGVGSPMVDVGRPIGAARLLLLGRLGRRGEVGRNAAAQPKLNRGRGAAGGGAVRGWGGGRGGGAGQLGRRPHGRRPRGARGPALPAHSPRGHAPVARARGSSARPVPALHLSQGGGGGGHRVGCVLGRRIGRLPHHRRHQHPQRALHAARSIWRVSPDQRLPARRG
mmetsp:Transcript_25123/g.81261  ORF Transcript_25123/g.81261 Transcript_25123/m.81261 type:complete len:354 (-) Transcript_25123:1756-2817(-)